MRVGFLLPSLLLLPTPAMALPFDLSPKNEDIEESVKVKEEPVLCPANFQSAPTKSLRKKVILSDDESVDDGPSTDEIDNSQKPCNHGNNNQVNLMENDNAEEPVQDTESDNEFAHLPKPKAIAVPDEDDYLDLQESVNTHLEKINQRVIKLFRVALRSTTPEAEMQRALLNGRNLVQKYNLDEAKLLERSKHADQVRAESISLTVNIFKNDGKNYNKFKDQDWMCVLALAVAENYYVANQHFSGDPTSFIFSGLVPNVKLAVESFCRAFDHVQRLMLAYKCSRKKHGNSKPMIVRQNYALGMSITLRKMVRSERRKSRMKNSKALIVVANKAMEAECASLFANHYNGMPPTLENVAKAYKDGAKDSKKIKI